MQSSIGKIVSEIVSVLDSVAFGGLCAINLGEKRYIKKSICFGFSLIVVSLNSVLYHKSARVCCFLVCFNLRYKFCRYKRSGYFKNINSL